jgi:2-keto-3-deoxy-L-rhamnonate aldolase RhmA
VGTTGPRRIEALKRVGAAGQSVRRCVGIDAVSNERLETYAAMGYRLFTFGSDAGYLIEGGCATAEFARGVEGKVRPKSRKR